PLATSPMTVHPTEQCVQTFLRVVTVVPGGGGGPASALRTLASGSVPRAASVPAARPERRRKLRRSRVLPDCAGNAAASAPRRVRLSVLLISTVASFTWADIG